MTHAMRLARRGLGNVWPNPAVGCVIVADGRVVGRGWTQPTGRPHGERMALDQAGDLARGATAYVTLEPCAHHGRTPPCAEGLAQAGIARVVSALTDPDTRVAGRGHQMLRDAGIEVVEGVMAAEAAELQAGFLMRLTQGRPFVTLKLASSLDGRIAMASGESKWITGPHARAHVHALRAQHDAIMVGGATARADLPQLNVRGIAVPQQPVRIVVSSQALPPLPVQDDMHGPLWRVEGRPVDILRDLAQRGLTRIFCEGGGRLAARLLAAGLVDQIVGYTAGMALGSEARAFMGPTGWTALSEAPRFNLVETRQIGCDLFHRWRRA
ncbi:bifunctional diaminohydroxyphosphoribosylaminopyrimidine deaminase/5-amino-6-(5-phosphoribosylamino)uracil reductase RibD [Paracoccus sp. 1_MG-2023]|uniref:bifunctional diaminohydroxyphosphoribosylaminopyrimidine deaminase/5-amino-6-(5-phosphoribosylamino)uracil reductase RibD n=1 Tax=unclassified Paracoccus (in: a-proteobacteria) TaxID=2688777 RepID=UPI001C0A573E|nr:MULTISPECIES: bifunctional diaminohydroxyphosphoribosylaminopyrimidine deaminase/5-amino-6-(5-phosphoribosylamino)uracil reductase RibD [unclassified Paracoccus (in: a-proteobacteria)]MBU2957473.1 bifunctional diaminohydroxyphosphoribosylaminopyrimidine deaminase/5-amino-6-(5-phosphoribosylamino)uracil reductase RibD [Paracoccus sp. C2R09]MDO6669671.1 bifunctional diaminohydroxyphosphoribosylaminopyrimidine deaminase/5-amino-6-(5-phosphoribosylamino)uracil reductase RibD [Paracoccus sp. 1_MG-2